MGSTNLTIGIISRRLGYSRAEAAGLVELIPEWDRESIEIEARRTTSPVGVAAIVCAALQRSADQVGDPERQRVAQEFAQRHTARLANEIDCWAQAKDRGQIVTGGVRDTGPRCYPTPAVELPCEWE